MDQEREVQVTGGVGDVVLAKAELSEGEIVRMNRVEGADFDDETFSFRLTNESQGDKTLFMLSVRNQLEHTVKYDLYVYYAEGDDPVYTSSCPLRPGTWVFEGWPQEIVKFEVSRARFLEGESSLCQ